MADGNQQHGFNFPRKAFASALRPGEIIVDLFAGGGGASEALRQALGRDPDIAINHDEQAIGMHAANHPFTKHMREDVWEADPVTEVAGRRPGWFHSSPDCTHFSQAKGGQPRDRATRSLSWVVLKWCGSLKKAGLAPRIVSLENVKQIRSWGPLVAKRDKVTGRVMKLDGSVAAKGERVPVANQFLIPDKRHAGRTWRSFLAELRGLGYQVDHRLLVASDFGAGTSRERLFLLARCDGEAPQWPEPTHGPDRAQPYVTAADCIDWSVPCPSIFERKRPLAEATCRRIAKGVKRYVLDAAEPFFITEHANGSNQRTWSGKEPLRTQCAGVKGGHFALAATHLVKFRGDSDGAPAAKPMPTITSGAGAARPAGAAHAMGVITAFLEQANGGGENGNPARARSACEPVSSITGTGSQQRVVECTLSPNYEAGALRVAAFLMRYHSCGGQHAQLNVPLTTVTTKDRLALVTVTIKGTPYVIVDIGLRMLRREELYRAQGFPADYIIDRTADGRKLSISASVRMVGNSVSPPPLVAIARANLDEVQMLREAA
ncbi:DNA cytosine methyltransferase [Dyella halodurans]|uniref:DNA (cytosine-5-)-methyltransferase n=1 Tax=Dyella halodurans TaxID=1920171 RepID=A0ABV9C0H4_9GAMM|nr:DNA cytosine methyltransferase [Dyella halodurans]